MAKETKQEAEKITQLFLHQAIMIDGQTEKTLNRVKSIKSMYWDGDFVIIEARGGRHKIPSSAVANSIVVSE